MTDALQATHPIPKMLIADDDPGIVQYLAERCGKMGFEVRTAVNGLQALIMATRDPPDVLIVDVNMPEVDGLSVCTRLLELNKKALEIVVVTGSPSPETIARCTGMGASYVRKGADLWVSVRSALTVIFPDMADAKVGEGASHGRERAWGRPRVLVVDRDPAVATFLSSRLSKLGVDTIYASDGLKGFQVACKEKPSVIISDYLMSNGDALYLLCKLRGAPATADIPFFVMSGRHLDTLTEQSLQREICGKPGAVRVFRKPLDIDEVFGALQNFCAFESQPVAQ
jgi:CheY-like chemotaxis protein